MKVLLIIPAYNEEENILKTYKSIMDYNEESKTNYEVIVINDGSKDKTREILDKENIPHIDLIHNLGIGGERFKQDINMLTIIIMILLFNLMETDNTMLIM